MRGDNERQWEAMGDKTLGRARFAPRILIPLPEEFVSPSMPHQFPRYLQHVKPRSCHFDNMCNIFYGNCSIWEQETDGKSSIVELETFFWPESEIFGASNNLGLVQLEVLLGAAVVCAWGWLRVSVSWVGLAIPGRSKVGL